MRREGLRGERADHASRSTKPSTESPNLSARARSSLLPAEGLFLPSTQATERVEVEDDGAGLAGGHEELRAERWPHACTSRASCARFTTSRLVRFAPCSSSWLPKAAYGIVHELTRHILRRPVVGDQRRGANAATVGCSSSVAPTPGRGGSPAAPSSGARRCASRSIASSKRRRASSSLELVRVLGVWSGPSRDPRFHAVTIGVECIVDAAGQAAEEPARDPRGEALREGRGCRAVLAFDAQDIVAASVDPDRHSPRVSLDGP